MMQFLSDRTGKAQGIIDKILETLPKDFEKASMRDKAGLLKILAETFGVKQTAELFTGETTRVIHTNAEMTEEEVEKILDE